MITRRTHAAAPARARQPKPDHRRGGFTVLETLVAIAILVIAITGPMVFAQQSLRAANLARDQVTAFYLAQDAVEFVKHVRDENALSTFRGNWLVGLEDCFAVEIEAESGCQISTPEWAAETVDDAVAACSGANCCLFEQGNLFGIFGNNPVTDCDEEDASRFSRRVRIMTAAGGDPQADADGDTFADGSEEVLVEVEVTWVTGGIGGERGVLVREHVYNWIQ